MSVFKKLYKFSNSWTGTIIIVLLVIFFLFQAFVIPSGSMKNTLLIKDFLFVKKFSYGVPTPRIPWLEVPILPDFNDNGHLIEGQRPKRGDIVVFRNPADTKIHYVKRNVAVGGDKVVYANKTLFVRMNEGDEYMRENFAKDDLITLGGELFVREPYKQKGIHYDERVDIEPLIIHYLNQNAFAMKPVFYKELGRNLGMSGGNAYLFEVPEDEFFMMGDNRDHSNDSRFWGSVPYRLIVGTPWLVYLSFDDEWNVRWDRIGRFVDTLENDEKFIREEKSSSGDFS